MALLEGCEGSSVFGGKVVLVAGGWDPLHSGHIAHIREAKSLGDYLIVVTHEDEVLEKKKGFCLLPLKDRLEVLKAIKWVDMVVVSSQFGDRDGTVVKTLEALKPHIFAKGGDRTPSNMPEGELEVCRRLGITVVYGVGGEKVGSSSLFVRRVVKKFSEKGQWLKRFHELW